MALTPQEALNNLIAASKEFKGTLAEHQALAESGQIMQGVLGDHLKREAKKLPKDKPKEESKSA